MSFVNGIKKAVEITVKNKDTWPVLGCVSAGLVFMGVTGIRELNDNSVRVLPSKRSDGEYYLKQNKT